MQTYGPNNYEGNVFYNDFQPAYGNDNNSNEAVGAKSEAGSSNGDNSLVFGMNDGDINAHFMEVMKGKINELIRF